MKNLTKWFVEVIGMADYPENPFIKMLDYKTGAIVMAFIVNTIAYIKGQSILGVSATFLILIVILMLIDWFTGVRASRSKGQKFQSNKVIPTVFKFITLWLWLWLSREMTTVYDDIEIADITISFISTFVLILVTLREFVSIGENLEKIYGHKHYLFHLVDDIFGMFESIFKKKIKK